jgi:hypothetical protein
LRRDGVWKRHQGREGFIVGKGKRCDEVRGLLQRTNHSLIARAAVCPGLFHLFFKDLPLPPGLFYSNAYSAMPPTTCEKPPST